MTDSASSDAAVIVERDVWIPMRDGVLLQADVWRPATEGRYPVLLQRTPYNRADSFAVIVNAGIEPLRAVANGFVVVIQDTRGRFGSQGRFDPFRQEAADGYDTVQWLAGQAYSNGNVGMYGASYYAATQLLAATQRPSALKAIAPQMTASDYHDTWTYSGGALQLGFVLYWALGLAAAELARRQAAGESLDAEAAELQVLLADPWSAFRSRPLTEIGALRTLLPAWIDWLDHPTRDDYWEAISIAERYASLDVPALHIGGWFDLFLSGTIANYQGMSTSGARQRLIVGPWAHAVTYDALGEVDYGGAASAAALDMTGLQLDWFSSFLKDEPAELSAPPVTVFVMGDNTWRDEDAWPPARSRLERFFLSTGPADGSADGRLGHEPPAADGGSSPYVFDPAQPVPTVGGATFLPGAYIGLHAGPRDQRAVEQRPDVLSYTSDVLSEDVELCGPVAVTLYAATSAPDTDWTAKLVEVYPDGRALNICDGIIRARYHHRTDDDDLATPGEPHEFRIDLGSTSIVLFAGHALRLEISSSNFPRFDVNPNHGGVIAQSTVEDYVVAHQRIFHDRDRPSHLEICTVPRQGRSRN
ncbi:MAG: X-Pro dipeptidyl-peptidase domain protein [Actinomycetia bacterium]|nr:X-Pro dipeptidyl-peptidase domain protein [Actinomycetes bacterium]